MTPEGRIKDLVKQMLASINCGAAKDAAKMDSTYEGWYFMPVPTGYGVRGPGDFIGHFRGRFFSIETKVPRKNPTPLQQHQINAVQVSGGFAFVVRDATDVTMVKVCLLHLTEVQPRGCAT